MSFSVLVIGGTGVFGRYIVQDLMASPLDFEITVAARRKSAFDLTFPSRSPGLKFSPCDLAVPGTWQPLVTAHDAVILAAGPFQGIPADLARFAAASGKHYLDLCDDPGYAERLRGMKAEFANARGILLTGLSSLPGISLPLAALAARNLDTVREARVGLFIGNRNRKGRGAVFSALQNLTGTVDIIEGGKLGRVPGWSRRVNYAYPEPIGTVPSYAFASPDPALFAEKFPLETLSVSVGFEWAAARATFRAFKFVADAGGYGLVKRAVKFFFPLFELAHGFGTERGCVSVTLVGTRDGRGHSVCASLYADRKGQRMASLPAVIACEAIAKGEVGKTGLTSLAEWIAPEDFLSRLEAKGMSLMIEDLG